MHNIGVKILFLYMLRPFHLSQNWLLFMKDKSQTYNIMYCYIRFNIRITEVGIFCQEALWPERYAFQPFLTYHFR